MNASFIKKLFGNVWVLAAVFMIAWRAVLTLMTFVADRVIPFSPSYPYYDALLADKGPWWLVRWAGFDGVHYLTIATKGYMGTGLIQAFFPLFPYLSQLFNLFHNPVIAGLLTAHLAMYLMLVFAGMVLKEEKKTHSLVALYLAMLVYPTSLFFGAMYTESLFLFLVFSAFYAMRKHRWDVAIFCSFFATATRITGIFLVLALCIEMYKAFRGSKTYAKYNTASVLTCLAGIAVVGSAGLLLYMAFLQWKFHDPLYFLHVQAEFGGGRQETLIPLPQVIYRYLHIFFTFFIRGKFQQPVWSWSYYSYLQELIMTVFVGVMLSIATVKRWIVRTSYLFYAWGAYILPPLTGTLQSMPRYLMVVFPLFFLMERLYWEKRIIFYVLCGVQIVLLLMNTVLFVQGLWVA